jgi:hypothetical protein
VYLLEYSPSIWKIADSQSDKTKAMTITMVFAAPPYSTHSTHHKEYEKILNGGYESG